MKIKFKRLIWLVFIVVGSHLISAVAYSISLDDVSFVSLPGDRSQIKLILSEPPTTEPLDFNIANPARIAIDFPGTTLNLENKFQNIGIGMVNSFNAVESAGRTRVVINLTRSVPYNLVVEENSVVLTIESDVGSTASNDGGGAIVADGGFSPEVDRGSLESIDFRRGEGGEGRIIVNLSDSSIPVDMGFEGGKVTVNFIGAQLPEHLDRKLDVIDFATPVKEIDTTSRGDNTVMKITTVSQDYDHLAYQSDDRYTIEFKPLTREEIEESKKDKFTGERLSLNFQNIEVRAVLQLLADFTGFNLVASDTVGGSITLRLKNVPWDQALDIILRNQGLAKRQVGNVITVAPAEEIAARERLELEAKRQIEELAPLRTEFVQVNYADAEDIASLVRTGESNLLSERGNISVDSRTNTLIIQDVSISLQGHSQFD